jgi:hypothetical protein
MPSWQQAQAAAQRAFTSIYNDIGNTYQQVMFQGTGLHYRQDFNRDAGARVNPEYIRADQLYAAQQQEWERLGGITAADYQASNIDWEEYGEYLAEMKARYPEWDEREQGQQGISQEVSLEPEWGR